MGPQAWGPLLYESVYLRIHVAVCVVLRVVRALCNYGTVCTCWGNWATVPCVPVGCCEAACLGCVSPGNVMSLDDRGGDPL